jgi:hypothetical protein
MSIELIQPDSAETWRQARALVEQHAASLGVDQHAPDIGKSTAYSLRRRHEAGDWDGFSLRLSSPQGGSAATDSCCWTPWRR